MPIPVLVVPPRPPELPAVPPPQQPTPVVQTGPHLRNDAFLTQWVEAFERVMKDAWLALSNAISAIEARILKLEQRVADTYTYGQKGGLTLLEDDPNWIALPLMVVRDEELLECVGRLLVGPSDSTVTCDVLHNGATVTTLAFSDTSLVTFALPTPRKLLKNDILAVQLTGDDPTATDLVVELRCR